MNDGIKLKRLAPGHYIIEGIGYRVFRHEGRSWSGHRGAYAFVKWEMVRETDDGTIFERDCFGHNRAILSSGTLAGLKKRITRYFTPYVLNAEA